MTSAPTWIQRAILPIGIFVGSAALAAACTLAFWPGNGAVAARSTPVDLDPWRRLRAEDRGLFPARQAAFPGRVPLRLDPTDDLHLRILWHLEHPSAIDPEDSLRRIAQPHEDPLRQIRMILVQDRPGHGASKVAIKLAAGGELSSYAWLAAWIDLRDLPALVDVMAAHPRRVKDEAWLAVLTRAARAPLPVWVACIDAGMRELGSSGGQTSFVAAAIRAALGAPSGAPERRCLAHLARGLGTLTERERSAVSERIGSLSEDHRVLGLLRP